MIDFACKKFEMNEVIKCTLGLTKSEYKLMDFFLEKENQWFSTSKLSNLFELNITTIQRAVKTLYEKDILDRRQDNLEQGGYEYYYKIKDQKFIRQKIMSIIQNWIDKVEKELNKL